MKSILVADSGQSKMTHRSVMGFNSVPGHVCGHFKGLHVIFMADVALLTKRRHKWLARPGAVRNTAHVSKLVEKHVNS